MEVCSKGYYSNSSAIDCEPSKSGYYCDSETTSEKDMLENKPCPEGTNCDGTKGSVDEIPELVQNSCPLGYYCLRGDQNEGKPQPCPTGTYGAEMGL